MLKKFFILLILTITSGQNICIAQTVYIFNSIPPPSIKLKIYEDDKKIEKIKAYSCFKWENARNKKNVKFTFKTGLFKHQINLNLKDKKVVFLYVEYFTNGITVNERDILSAPRVILDDYYANGYYKGTEEKLANSEKVNWTETTLKEKFDNYIEEYEGIFEESYLSNNSVRYKVGIVKVGKEYSVIYISGSDNGIWTKGDLKAIFHTTKIPNMLYADWYMGDKKIVKDLLVSFKENSFSIILPSGNEHKFLKQYPINENSLNEEPNKEIVKSSGTGFSISQDGLIVTNYHVIENAKQISIKGINGDLSKSYKAKIITSDKNNDLAIVQISDSSFKSISNVPFVIKPNTSDVGIDVFVMGYPLISSMGSEIKLTNGIISSKTGFQGDITSYQVSAPIQPGNSGGPLFDKSGNLIGIINAKHIGAENVSYAIKTNYLNNLIDLLPTKPKLNTINKLEKLPLSEQVKVLNKFVYLIEVSY